MDVLVLIDALDDLVHDGKPIRFTNQVRVDKKGIYEILDEIRATVPEEIKQAAGSSRGGKTCWGRPSARPSGSPHRRARTGIA